MGCQIDTAYNNQGLAYLLTGPPRVLVHGPVERQIFADVLWALSGLGLGPIWPSSFSRARWLRSVLARLLLVCCSARTEESEGVFH